MRRPLACAPPTSASRHSAAPVEGSSWLAATLRRRPARRWPVLEPAQLLDPAARDLAVGADGQRHAGREPARQVAQAVAEVGLGAWAQHDAGATARELLQFDRGDMGGVHQLPARVHAGVAQQPFDRPRAGGGEAVAHLGQLLGDVDVQRAVAAVGQCAQRLRPHRAQRMQRRAAGQQRPAGSAHGTLQRHHLVHRGAEAALALAQRTAVESAGHVQRRQQAEPDPGLQRRRDQRVAHRARRRVGAPVRLVVQVVELADRGVAMQQQVGVELGGDRVQRRRVDRAGIAVHGFAPAPEGVALGGLAFGEPGHRALEGVRMQVRHPRHHPAAQRRGVGPRCAGRHLDQVAGGVDGQADVARPARRQQCLLGVPDAVAGAVGRHRRLLGWCGG